MHSKQVRRRRLVLAVLVVISLILLTDYFGESPSSPLHTIQRGIVEVFSPIQQGASTVLSPVRDIGNWFSDTFKARSQVKQLKADNQKLVAELARARSALAENVQLSRLVGLDHSDSISSYHPVAANVISRDPIVWYLQIEVDRGSDDGIRVGDPVIGDGGLVGNVSTVGATYSEVTLITNHTMSEAAQVVDQKNDSGVLVPAVGDPNQLVMQYLPTNAQGIRTGNLVLTVGFKSGSLQDLYPPGIPIGTVTNFNQAALANNGTVHVSPVADLAHISVVQILTRPRARGVRAQLP
ncbi:MAG TPA: rod shape-determining protein MreC [Solirubrobacteraceae bacterium]